MRASTGRSGRSCQADVSAAVYDGSTHVGAVVERADGAGFDAIDVDGKYLGTFSSRAAASRAIPPAGAAS